MLYLVHAGLLDIPILYLSRAINSTRPEYYRQLQAVREQDRWEEWVLYMLRAITSSAVSTLQLVEGIRDLMQNTKQQLRQKLPKIYSQDLLNNLFRHPYTRIDYMERDLPQERQTVGKYLKQLAEAGFVVEVKRGRNNYCINGPLVALFLKVSTKEQGQTGAGNK